MVIGKINRDKFIIYLSLILQIIFIIIFVPDLQINLFTPFVLDFITNPTIDPWQNWLNSGGRTDSFPYGPVMLAYFASISWVCGILPMENSHQFGIALGLFLSELGILKIISKNFEKHRSKLQILVVTSPILVFATFIHGQLDLLPSALLASGLVYLRQNKWRETALLIGFSIATKFSALIALPLILIFVVRNKKYRDQLRLFLAWLMPGLALTFLPLLLPGYRQMVVSTPQTRAIFEYGLQISQNFKLLMAPVLIAIFLTFAIRLKRANTRMLFILCGTLLSAFPLVVPSSPGWYLWGLMPFLAMSVSLPSRYLGLIISLQILEAINSFLLSSLGHLRSATFIDSNYLIDSSNIYDLPDWVLNSSQTGMLLTGIFVLYKVLTRGLSQEDTYRLSDSPLSLAVAGDSGTGKDTLCESLASLFSDDRCTFLLGDDYHSYDRGSVTWNSVTHLNPVANDLARLERDSLDLLNGKPVWSRHYNHDHGRFTKARKIKESDVVAISGLHVVSIESIRKKVDLSIFLDMDNHLRAKLKIERDSIKRNKTAEQVIKSIESRAADRELFIQPQKDLANLVICVSESHTGLEDFKIVAKNLDVTATLRGLTFGRELTRFLISLANVQVELAYSDKPGTTYLKVKHCEEISGLDIGAIATKMIKNPEDILIENSKWHDGSLGICQLFMILAMLEMRTRKNLEGTIK